ncbi:MAG: hypothetical protein AAGH89_13620 [Verrucomicrobiota bacterium]
MPTLAPTKRRLLLLLGSLAVFAFAYTFAPKKRWVSQMGAPRHFAEIGFFTDAETPLPPPQALRSSEITKKEEPGKLLYTWQDTRERWSRYIQGRIPPRFTDDEAQVVTLPGGGQIRIAWASMGYHPSLGDEFPSKETFTPTMATVRGDTWEPLDEESFRALQLQERGQAYWTTSRISRWEPGEFSLDLTFIHDGISNLTPVGRLEVMNLDTMTQVESMAGGILNVMPPNTLYEAIPVEVFYPARLAVGFDIGYGPIEEMRLPLSPGKRGSLSALEAEFISVQRIAWKSAQNSATIKRTKNREERAVIFTLDEQVKRTPRTDVLFSISPPELGRFCDFVLVDRHGKEEKVTQRQSYRLSYLTTKTLPEDLSELVLRYRPNHARVVFELPPLRGVPPVNQDIENVFDVVIPHLEVHHSHELKWTISQQAGVRFAFRDAEFPTDYFPHRFENQSLGELLDEYLAHHPQGSRVRLNSKTHLLEIPKPFSFEKTWKAVRKRLGI